jgi:glycoprotein endo-alpha-1,2-mannosidase
MDRYGIVNKDDIEADVESKSSSDSVYDEQDGSWEDEPSSSDDDDDFAGSTDSTNATGRSQRSTRFSSSLEALPTTAPGLPIGNPFDGHHNNNDMLLSKNRSNDLLMEPSLDRDADSLDEFLDDDYRTGGSVTQRSTVSKTKMIAVRLVVILALFGSGVAVGILILRSKDGRTSSSSISSDETTVTSSGPQNSANSSSNVGIPSQSPWVTPAADNIFSPSEVPTRLPTFVPSLTPTTVSPSSNPTQIPTKVLADDITISPTSSVNSTTTNTTNSTTISPTDYVVGVYYYPWHGDDFHNQQGYLREQLYPRQYPSLGEYNDSDPSIIAQHIQMFHRANVGVLVTSWWGPTRLEDNTTKGVIMEHPDIGTIQIALHYETTGRLGKEGEDIVNAKSDIQFMCENYFDHPNYYRIDGRPVLVLYISRRLHQVGKLEEALLTMRSTAAKCGHNLYLVGDQVFSQAPDPDEVHVPFWYFDAITNYDVYGSAGRPEGYAGKERVIEYYKHMEAWRDQAILDDCRFIPAVSPGYNDRGVRLDANNPALSRRLTADSEEGSLFHFQLQFAKELADSALNNLIFVNSFNEWHEDTQIEPVAYAEQADWPPLLTQGVEYVGYGNLYLDILGAAVSSSIEGGGIFDYLYGDTKQKERVM